LGSCRVISELFPLLIMSNHKTKEQTRGSVECTK
jgi:hypothetical protein